MQSMIRAWFKYFILAGIFGVCINLIYLALPVYVMVVYDRVLYSFTKATLYSLSIGLLFSLIFMGILEYLKERVLGQAGRNLSATMLTPVIKAMAMGETKGYDRGLQDLETLRSAVNQGVLLRSLEIPWVVLYLWVLYIIHPLVGAVAAGTVFIAVTAQALLRILEKRQYTLADVVFYANNRMVLNALSKVALVRGMGMLPAIIQKYQRRDKKMVSSADHAHVLIGSFTGFVHLIGVAGVFTTGAYVFFSDQVTSGEIFASVLLTVRLFYPLQHNLDTMKISIEARGAYKRLKAYVKTSKGWDKFSLPDLKGALAVEKASLVIDGKAVLSNISLSLDSGEILGIFGPSCAGKTSLCRMILGIWTPVSGKIRLDGAEIGHWPADDLGRSVGYMPQEPELFEASVAENIARLAKPEPDKVVVAAQKAGAHEMILRLPQGYDTRINGAGDNLAAGQKQLISLARAFYGNPKLLILDEPHTFLDEDGFRNLVAVFNRLKQEKITVVMVTDKINLLAGTDKILVVKEGQAAMYGPAGDVMAQLTGQQPQQQAAGV
ncbi:MAG: ATP-binding cassette domain-containing protein [Desulfobacterales bacterium]|nr:ATP-binding cassette domain-containing protein [Desulfobacterales bacterium]